MTKEPSGERKRLNDPGWTDHPIAAVFSWPLPVEVYAVHREPVCRKDEVCEASP